MIGVRLGVDQQTHGLRRELLHGIEDGPGILRKVSAVDEHDAILRQNDRAIRLAGGANVSEDAVLDLLELRIKLLCGRDGGQQQEANDRMQNGVCFVIHDASRWCAGAMLGCLL